MEASSILVGNIYRTAEGEMRRVTSMDKGNVIFSSAMSPHGPGTVAHSPDKHLPLAQFAREVESEVRPAPRG